MKRLLIVLIVAAFGATGCGAAKDSGDSEARASVPAGEERPSKEDATREMRPPQTEIAVMEDEASGKTEATREAAAETPAPTLSKPGRQMNTEAAPAGGVDTSSLPAAPAWQLPNLEGKAVSSADFSGKVVIFDFWATWCGPCRMEIPHFIDLQRTYGEKGLEIVGVAMDQQGALVVKPFVDQAGVNYHTVIGNAEVASLYGPIRGIPTTFVISPDGKIYKKYVGYRPKEVFEADIRALLGLS